MKSPLMLCMTLFTMLAPNNQAATFGEDAAFLKKHTDLVVLKDASGGAQVAVAPAWQGRVMTSTTAGDTGQSFGWINRELIASGERQPHIHVFGGEDRFWIGPEGGQYSIFFAKGSPFDLDHWFTPAAIDTMPYAVVRKSNTEVYFNAAFTLTNYTGTRFALKVDRAVRLLQPAEAWKKLGAAASQDVHLVAYESENRITNQGEAPWEKKTGLLSIWILGMFNHSPGTTIVVPIKQGPEAELGVPVTADYFGPMPSERLVIKKDVVFFKGDGQYRSKIGINPKRSRSVLGSFDAQSGGLTIIQFSQPEGVVDYVNSLWKIQDEPYRGDVANSYNDGPASPGAKPLGPFYEMESSSPAAALGPGRNLIHVHRTIHLTGSASALDKVSRAVLGVSLDEIRNALPH